MYKTIVFAYDGSVAGRHALLESADIGGSSEVALHLLAVVPPSAALYTPGGAAVDVSDEGNEDDVKRVLREGAQLFAKRSLQVTEHLSYGVPNEEICRLAKNLACDLIVVGHQRRTTWLSRWWKGSVGSDLLEDAPCSVLVVLSDIG